MSRNTLTLVVTVSGLSCSLPAPAADCNQNGKEDNCDISCSSTGCAGVVGCGSSNDCNANGIPDECDTFEATSLRSVRVASASEPVFMAAPPGDSRLWIVEKAGRIKLLSGGAVLATPYLDISSRIATDGERGLVGLAFHPAFSSNALFYLYYTNTSGNIVIARYRASGGNPTSNTASSIEVVLKSMETTSSFHNGGCLQFGPDGYLYCGIGDGGVDGNGQNPSTLFGKMIRLDVNNPPTYVPSTNPFVGTAPLDEIWSLGWRNPWRFSFDGLTGNMFIADVGTNLREEVDVEPPGTGGRNYGWRCMEGTVCTGLTGCRCNELRLTLPVHEYSHSTGSCAIIGGYVYRGCGVPSLQGTYFYADLCGNYIKSFRYSSAIGITEHRDRTAELGQGTVQTIYSFGEDGFGELYYAGSAGVYKIVAGTTVNPVCGNEVLELGEECDDGNTINGDGCSSVCDIESTSATGACCVSQTCVVQTASECVADSGNYQGDDSVCPDACLLDGGPSCNDLRDSSPLKAQCSSDGTVNYLVVFEDSGFSGETVTVAVDNNGTRRVFNPTIEGRLASGSVCCLHGAVMVSLLDPSGCVPPVSISCP